MNSVESSRIMDDLATGKDPPISHTAADIHTEQRILLNCARRMDLNSASHAMKKDGFLFAFRDDLRFLSSFFI